MWCMLNVGKTHDTVRVVNDQIGTPTYTYAEELLADKYYEGVYIVKDVKAAIYWYEKAANQGSVYAMYRAGYIYYSEPIDYNKAGQWFSLAAEKGDKDAEEVLRNNLRYNRFTKKWDAVR